LKNDRKNFLKVWNNKFDKTYRLDQCFSTAGPRTGAGLRGRFCRSLGTYQQACEQYAGTKIPLMVRKIIILFNYFIIISFLLSEIKIYRSAVVILKIFQSMVLKRLRNTDLIHEIWLEIKNTVINQIYYYSIIENLSWVKLNFYD
jgi:hypothetical protein